MSQSVCVFLALLSSQGLCALGEGIPATALSADDVCGEGAACALNALQRVRVSAQGDSKVSAEEDPDDASGELTTEQNFAANIAGLEASETAMTFAGGGYKAMATYVGTMIAMQNKASKKLGCNATLAEVFANTDTFVSNSGGGWFFAQLAYSPVFESIVTEASWSPDQAQQIYNDRWTSPFLDFARTGKSSFHFLTIVDSIVEVDAQIHADFIANGVPLKFMSGAMGLALHALRFTGKIDELTHSIMEGVLLTRSPCGCEAMALSKGSPGSAGCKCKSLPATVTAEAIQMAFHEQPSTKSMGRALGIAPGLLGTVVGLVQGLAQNVREFYGLWKHTALSWTNIVAGMLSAGGSQLDPNRRLGSEHVNSFAKNKFWIACISLVTPGGRDTDLQANAFMTRMNRLYFTVDSKEMGDFNLYTPAKIVTKMGQGVGGGRAGVGVPLCGRKDCFGFYNKWAAEGKIPFVTMKKDAAPFYPYMNLGQKFSGQQLLNRVVASSSAAIGMAILAPTYGIGNKLATWVAKSTNPYDQALIIQERAVGRGDLMFWRTLRDFAKWNVLPLVDGVLSENTGVMNAVATGHIEITAHPAFGPQYLLKLFSAYDKLPAKSVITDATQFGGLPGLQIFEEEATTIDDAIAAFPTLENYVDESQASFLKGMSFGTVSAMTFDNMWAGVTAGETVKINIMNTLSTIGIQATNSFYAYGAYIKEVAMTLTLASNTDAVDEILDKFYFGIGGRDAPTGCAVTGAEEE